RRGGPPRRPNSGEPGRERRGFGRGADHPARRAATLLEQLVRGFPTVPEYRHLLACCYRDIPPDPVGRGQRRTRSNTGRAEDLLRQLVADFPKVPDYRFDLCETLIRSAPLDQLRSGESANKARERLEEAVSLSADLVAHYPN